VTQSQEASQQQKNCEKQGRPNVGRAIKKLRAMETYEKQKNRYQLCLLLLNNHVGLKNNKRNHRTGISIQP